MYVHICNLVSILFLKKIVLKSFFFSLLFEEKAFSVEIL